LEIQKKTKCIYPLYPGHLEFDPIKGNLKEVYLKWKGGNRESKVQKTLLSVKVITGPWQKRLV